MLMSPKISLNSKNLDTLLAGGVEPGIITNFYGTPGVGKTNIVIQLAVSTIRQGKRAVFVDTERGFSPERFMQMTSGNGTGEQDLSKVILFEPSSFDEQDKKIRELEAFLKKEKDIGLIVVDSLVSLYRLHMGGSETENIQKANQKLGQQLSILAKIAKEHNLPVVVTNQVYEDFEKKELELVGRDIPKYACKNIIFLEKSITGKRRATLMKHRYLPEDQKAEFLIVNEGLIDPKKGLF